MTASFLATMVIGLWVSALPALPLLAVAFVAANGDLLWRKPHSPSRPA
jgi:nitrate reductase NapE component